MNTQQVKELVRRSMRNWPLYGDDDTVICKQFECGDWSLNYYGRPRRCTYWEANIIAGVFFLLHIGVVEHHRGQGHGSALYELLTDMARDLGCSQIRQHPSGNTFTGESRLRYLCRRGWLPTGGSEVFKTLAVPTPEHLEELRDRGWNLAAMEVRA